MTTTPIEDPCVNCGGPIEWTRSSWTLGGGEQRDPTGWRRSTFHVGGGRRCPDGTPGLVPLARAPGRCPDCRCLAFHIVEGNWGNTLLCPDCGYKFYFSLGD